MIIEEAQRLAQVKEYYFATKLREIRARVAQGEDIINLGIGNPDLAPSDQTLKTLVNAVVEPGVHGYQPYKGIPALRRAFADWYLSTYGVDIDPEKEVLPLMGSKEGIMHTCMAFLNPGDEVLIPNPGYPTYRSNVDLVGATARPYLLEEEKGWLPDLEALAQEDLSRVKMMWVSYPHMPTGATATREFFIQLVAFAREHKILLCHDNPYSLIMNPDPMSILSVPGAREVAIEFNSLSKSHHMAGWRIGLVAGAEPYLQAILKVKSNMDSGMFMPLQQAAVAALQNPYEWHRQRNEAFKLRRHIGEEILRSLECKVREGQVGMFIWARIPDHIANAQIFSDQILNETSVFLTPGFIFGSAGDRYIRLSLCSPKSQLQQALQRILERQLTQAPS
ncbi:MAG: aminotransferase class I/II-fold pyridoxal phosphate-dependent enzyme [Bacteroidota bacterium]